MNLSRREHSRIHAELDNLARIDILTADQVRVLKDRYPTTAVDFLALIRIFTVLGTLTAMAGLVVLIREHLNWWLVSEAGLAVLGAGLLLLGHWLRARKVMAVTGEAVELVGCVALQGLVVVLAAHYSTGGGKWPALVGLDTLLALALAYLLANRLVLWWACGNFFFWFGAQTGYMSGWGCYWLGMTYPARFLAAGAVTLLLAWLHAASIRGRWAPFSRVYAHFGLLIANLALWFLSLFGYFETYDYRWSDTAVERLLFTLLWGAVAGGALFAGARLNVRLLRGYGLTFLIINLYTFYFQFIAANTAELGFVHLLIVGGSLLWLARHYERKRREARDAAAADENP